MVVYETKILGNDSVEVGETTVVAGWANPVAMWTYSSSEPKIASVNATSGIVTGKKEGSTTIVAQLTACPAISLAKTMKVVKAANPMAVKAKSANVRFNRVKKRAVTISGRFVFTTKAKGKVTYLITRWQRGLRRSCP